MTKEFIPYEQALELKELGFVEPCFGLFNNIEPNELYELHSHSTSANTGKLILAPLYQQTFRWFRRKYKLHPYIGLHDRENEESWRFEISILSKYELAYNQNIRKEPYYKYYEEAELACLIKLIEIVKKK
jgi:hypothetical protein